MQRGKERAVGGRVGSSGSRGDHACSMTAAVKVTRRLETKRCAHKESE
jgi:hypothetical protein